jgi:hypothetical protein
MTTDVNSQINDQEAVGAVLEYITDPDKPLEERFALLLGLVKVHVAEIAKLKEFRRRSCKAAWALAMPGSEASLTAFVHVGPGCEGPECTRHAHTILTHDAQRAFAALAALDPSGYLPVSGGSAAEGCLMRPGGPVSA